MTVSALGGCAHHPGIEAVTRCRQCGTPLCKNCIVPGETGTFCSTACSEKHKKFREQAKELDLKPRRPGFGEKFRKFMGQVVLMGIIIALIGAISYFIEIPVLSGFTRFILVMIGF